MSIELFVCCKGHMLWYGDVTNYIRIQPLLWIIELYCLVEGCIDTDWIVYYILKCYVRLNYIKLLDGYVDKMSMI